MNEITLDHIHEAALWAASEDQGPLAGVQRTYNQSRWDCGTSCCIWGAANLFAGNEPAGRGYGFELARGLEWAGSDLKRVLIWGLLRSTSTEPRQILDLLESDSVAGVDLTGIVLVGAYLADAKLAGVNMADSDLADAILDGADLTGANLSDSDLSGASLVRANLSGTNLSESCLTKANLTLADLTGADLTGATGIIR